MKVPKIPIRIPALPPVLAERAKEHFARYTPNLWAWSSATSILVLITVTLLARVFFAGAHLSTQAVDLGQRVVIQVATAQVEGNARHTKVQAPAATTTKGEGEETIISKEGLAPAPLASISSQTEKGLVPVVGSDGTLPWKYYARPYKSAEKRPIVAIVLTNLALSKNLTESALKLPHNITLSFSPYANDARKWATVAREEGFETLIDLPIQSRDYLQTGKDPGPYGLLEDANPNQNSTRMRWALSRITGFVGTLAPEDESMTGNLSAIRPTLIELAGHGVLFLYVKNPKNIGLVDLVKARQFFALGIDKVIDEDLGPGPIAKQLEELTALAKTQGYAVGFAHPYPPTLDALSHWADTLSAQGVDLVPVSAVGMKVLP